MPEKIIYCCETCGFYFRSTDNIVNTIRYECSVCKAISHRWLERCGNCGGMLVPLFIPGCPKCESKYVQIRGTISSLY